MSALRVSEWACIDDNTRKELALARAWLAEPSDPVAVLAEAEEARVRGDVVLATRLFDRAAVGMQRAGSPPRWELPGPLDADGGARYLNASHEEQQQRAGRSGPGQAIFLGSTRVASVAGMRVAIIEVASGARRLLSPRADAAIRGLIASDDGRFLAAEAGDEVLVWDGASFAGRVRVKAAHIQFAPAPNSRTLVLENGDGMTLWDAITRQTLPVVAGSEFLFVGDRLAHETDDHGIVVVEPATGQVVAKLPSPHPAPEGGGAWRLAASPDGRVLLRQWWMETGILEHPLRSGVEVWDTRTMRRLGAFDTAPMGLTVRPTFSRDGTRFFAPTARWLGVFDVQRARLEAAWPLYSHESRVRPVSDLRAVDELPIGEAVESITVTSDDTRVVACWVVWCEILDWRTGRHGVAGRDAQLLPDGSIISRNRDQPGHFDVLDANFQTQGLDLGAVDVEIVPTTSGEWRRSRKPFVALEPCGSDTKLRVSADGALVLKADTPGRPCVWKRDDGRLLPRPPVLPDFTPVTTVDLSGTRLLLVGAANTVRALDLETGELSQAREEDVTRLRAYGSLPFRISTDAWPRGTASQEANLLATNDGVLVREPAGGAFVVDATTGTKRWALDTEKRARGSSVALAPGWIALASGKYVDVWDAPSREHRQRLDCGGGVNRIAIDVSAAQVAASCGGRIVVWDLGTGVLRRRLQLPILGAGAFAVRGDWIVATVGNELVAWAGRAQAEAKWRWPISGSPAVSVATDGHVVAVAHAAGDVSLYSLADGRERLTARLWNASAPELVLQAPDGGAVWDADGGLLSASRCLRGEQEVPRELCESLWVQDDLWRQMK